MIFFQITSIISFCIYLNIALFILYKDIRSPLHRNFFYFTFSLAAWAFIDSLIFTGFAPDTLIILQKISYLPSFFFISFLMRFLLLLSGLFKNKKIRILYYSLVFILPSILTFKSLSANALEKGFPLGFWFLFYEFTETFYCCINICILYYWWRTTHINREKNQAAILLVSGSITVILGWAANYIMGFKNLPSIASNTTVFWILIMMFAMVRFRFMLFTPHEQGRQILINIDETAVLINPNNKIIFSNRLEWLIQNYPAELSVFMGYVVWYDEFMQRFENFIESEQCMLAFQIIVKKNGIMIPATVRMKKIEDRHLDLAGILVLIRENTGIKHLKNYFRITDREADIILNVISGASNRDIALRLAITENTVKSHITNIYNKLGIYNKIELFNILNDFDVSSENQS